MNAFERFTARYAESIGLWPGPGVTLILTGLEIPYAHVAEIARIEGRKAWDRVIGEPEYSDALTGSVAPHRGI